MRTDLDFREAALKETRAKTEYFIKKVTEDAAAVNSVS